MEWWKLFSGTFILIFLAELGDKTQLAAMAKTADSPEISTAKWVVFLGASAALVASTFIAVFMGHLLKSIVPDERYIRLAAAILFLVFGFSILYETYSSFRSGDAAPALAAAAEPKGGRTTSDSGMSVVGGLALRAAMDFETLSQNRYITLAEQASPELSAVLLDLAKEEESHLAHLCDLTTEERCDKVWRATPEVRESGISGRNFTASVADRQTLHELIRHEEATASFYRGLAGRTLIPSVRSVLLHLAVEEELHAEKLRRFV